MARVEGIIKSALERERQMARGKPSADLNLIISHVLDRVWFCPSGEREEVKGDEGMDRGSEKGA